MSEPDTPGREATPSAAPGCGGIAFLGCGQATAMHSRTLGRVEPDTQRFYASRAEERARAFSDRHDGAGWFAGYDAALRDDRVSIVFVATPPPLHRELVLAALAAGKDVIVEKPAFPRSVDFDEVESSAERAGRRVLVAENYAYKPLLNELRGLFDGDDLGRILFVNVNALKRQRADGWRGDETRTGGGALLEGGIHWVSLLARLGPRVTDVRALRAGADAGPERSMQMLLGYENGTVASLSYSWAVRSRLKGVRLSRIHGTEGSAVFESNGLFLAVLGRRWSLRPGGRDLLGYRAMFREFMPALRSGSPTSYTLGDARRDVELVEEAYRSAGVGDRAPSPRE